MCIARAITPPQLQRTFPKQSIEDCPKYQVQKKFLKMLPLPISKNLIEMGTNTNWSLTLQKTAKNEKGVETKENYILTHPTVSMLKLTLGLNF